jgi:hypothetical protein
MASFKASQFDYFSNHELTPPSLAADVGAPEFPPLKISASAGLPPSPEDSDTAGGRQVLIFSGNLGNFTCI